jgi:hypothetical protein
MSTVSVEVTALLNYGREQLEDAAIYHAARRYLLYVGSVPDAAWGELPWAVTWRDQWEKGISHRADEAAAMCEHTGEHAASVSQSATSCRNGGSGRPRQF